MTYIRKIGAGLVVTFALQSWMAAQSLFDVASIRPNPNRGNPSFIVNPDGIIYARVTLLECINTAYGVKPYQISGPDWINRELFDITAKAEGSHSKDEIMQMLQALLADRFKLAFHRDHKELPVYALMVGKNGPKLRVSDGDGDFRTGPATGGLGFQKISMTDFASLFLSRIPMIGRPVLDKTGLQGRYDFTLQLSPAGNADIVDTKRAAKEEGFSLFAYSLDQLGLRLDPQKAVIEFLMIDHVERPSEN
jgi:uncharacterized protein (TIGR03435 family)